MPPKKNGHATNEELREIVGAETRRAVTDAMPEMELAMRRVISTFEISVNSTMNETHVLPYWIQWIVTKLHEGDTIRLMRVKLFREFIRNTRTGRLLCWLYKTFRKPLKEAVTLLVGALLLLAVSKVFPALGELLKELLKAF